MDVSGGPAAAAWPQVGPGLAPRALRDSAAGAASSASASYDGMSAGWPASGFGADAVRVHVVQHAAHCVT